MLEKRKEKQIIDAVRVGKDNGVKKIVIIGGYQADKVADLLKENNIGILI